MTAFDAAIATLVELILVVHNNTIQPNTENVTKREANGNQSGKFGESYG